MPVMGPMTPAVALAVVNTGMLLALTAVWVRNYRTFGSTMALALVGFAAVLLAESVVAVYFFFDMGSHLYAMDPLAATVVTALRALQFLAIALLTYATMR
jgi:hypothetical protein